MAIVTYEQEHLCKFIGKELPMKDIEYAITMLGMTFEKYEGTTIFLDVTPNRIDLLSIEGLGRAISSFLGIKTGFRKYEVNSTDLKIRSDSSVRKVRPYILAAVVKDIEMTQDCLEYLIQLQEKIHDTFGRKRRRVSIGIHNLDTIKFPLLYKAFKPSELSFTPLGLDKELTLSEILSTHEKGMEYAHILKNNSKYPIVLDSENKVLSFPPIINSKLTEVSTTTKNLLIEVTGTSKLAIQSTICVLLSALADRGGTLYSVNSYSSTPTLEGAEMKLSPSNISKVLGIKLPANDVKSLLEKMGYSVSSGKKLHVKIPAYRADVIHEIDLIEDVAIAFDYNKIEPELPNLATSGKLNNSFENLKSILTGAGFNQVITMTLTNTLKNFKSMLQDPDGFVEIRNPTTEEFSIMRTSLIPSHLAVFAQNKNQKTPQKLFEIGRCHEFHNNKLFDKTKLAISVLHSQASVTEIKSIAEVVLQEIGQCQIERTDNASFIKGRVGIIKINNKSIGVLGEIHPQVLNNFGLEQPVACLEIELESKEIT